MDPANLPVTSDYEPHYELQNLIMRIEEELQERSLVAQVEEKNNDGK